MLNGQWDIFINGKRLGAFDSIFDLFDWSALVQTHI
jgi:hypothetical protein